MPEAIATSTPKHVARIIAAQRKGCTEAIADKPEAKQDQVIVGLKATDVLELIGEIDRLSSLPAPATPLAPATPAEGG